MAIFNSYIKLPEGNNHPKSSTYIFLFSCGQDPGNAVEHNEGHYSSMIGSHSGPSDIASDNPWLYYRHPSTRLATFRLIVEMPVVTVTLATRLPMMSPSYPRVWSLNRSYCWLNHLKIDESPLFWVKSQWMLLKSNPWSTSGSLQDIF